MKTMNKFLSVLSVILIMGLTTSCEKFLDINTSPNSALSAPVGNILNAAFVSHIMSMEGEDARLACMWSQQYTGSDRQYSSYDAYLVNTEVFEWDKHYFGTCEQMEQVIKIAEETNNRFYIGVAKLLQAQSYGTVAALYGEAPFSEANQFPEIKSPVFDDEVAIYAGVQTLLDEAIAALSSGDGSDVEGADFFFSGNAASWEAVAHTLKARYALHQGNYALAATQAGMGIGAGGDWMAPHSGGYNQGMNIYHSFGQWDRFGYMTAWDAYLPQLLDTSNANYRGDSLTDESARFADLYTVVPEGYDLNYAGSMYAETSSFPIVTELENLLILAEAEARNGDNAAALTALNNARAAVLAKYPAGAYGSYALTDFDAGGIADNGQGSQSDNLMYEIVEEKYICLVGQIEVWSDMRRHDYMLTGLSPVSGSQWPQRFLYPQVEISANENTPDPIPDIYQKVELSK